MEMMNIILALMVTPSLGAPTLAHFDNVLTNTVHAANAVHATKSCAKRKCEKYCNSKGAGSECTDGKEGARCADDTECDPAYTCNRIGINECRKRENLDEGERCSRDAECKGTLVCATWGVNVCTKPLQKGDKCNRAAECADGLICRFSMVNACEDPVQVGKTCKETEECEVWDGSPYTIKCDRGGGQGYCRVSCDTDEICHDAEAYIHRGKIGLDYCLAGRGCFAYSPPNPPRPPPPPSPSPPRRAATREDK